MATAARRGAQHAGVVRLVLLGTPRLERADGTPVALERLLAVLLAMLAINGPMPRSRAAELLWPEADDKGARNNLRQRLFRLRQAAQFDVVVPDITLVLADGVTHDLTDLGARLEQDADAARGELLGALSFDDCLELADWVAVAREQWAVTRRNALAEIAARLEAAGQVAAALRYAERLVADDPLLEHAHRRLMRLHYLRGDRAAALTAFERCSNVLRRELKASPGKETLDLARTIESGAAPATTASGPKPVTVLRPPRLVGREREWQAIEQAWQQQRVIMLVGAPGIGKTRLASDFAAAHDDSAMFGARPGDARVPYSLAARMIRGLAQRWGAPPEAWVIAELARLVPEFGTAAAGRMQTLRLFQAVGAALAAWCSAGLAALAIDDLQFGDDASVELLLWLCAQERRSALRWMICLRDGESVPQLAEWRARAEADAVSEIALGSLDAAAVEALLDSLAIPGLDAQAWATPMARHTGGNPMFILETLLSMLARGADAFAGTGVRLPAPANIGQLIERRLDQLSPPALRLARVAALAGTDFSAELAAQVLGVHLLDIAEPWRELEAAQVIRGQSFAHDLILETTLRTVPQPIAQALHKSIAGHLQAQGAQHAPIARHWWEAGEWLNAGEAFEVAAKAARLASRRAEEVDCWVQAAESLERAGARDAAYRARCGSIESVILVKGVEQARRQTAALVAGARTDAERVSALTASAMAHLMAADFSSGVAAARAALQLAYERQQRWEQFEAARLLAVGLAQGGQAVEAIEVIEPFRDLVEREGTREQRGRFWADYAYVLNGARRLRQTAEALARAIDNARELGDLAELATLTSNLATVQGNLGRTAQALEHAQRARSLQHRLGEVSGPSGGAIDMYVGMFCAGLGRYREALDSLDAALDCFARDEQDVWMAAANNHRANLFIELGQLARAQKAIDGALPKLGSIRARRLVLAARLSLALGRSGDAQLRAAVEALGPGDDPYIAMLTRLETTSRKPPAEAVRCCLDIRAQAEELECFGVAVKARLLSVQCLQRAGQLADAADELRALRPERQQVQPSDLYFPQECWLGFELFDACGDRDEAQGELQRGVDWVRQIALPQVPDAFRDSFLTRNAVNRALLTTFDRRMAG